MHSRPHGASREDDHHQAKDARGDATFGHVDLDPTDDRNAGRVERGRIGAVSCACERSRENRHPQHLTLNLKTSSSTICFRLKMRPTTVPSPRSGE